MKLGKVVPIADAKAKILPGTWVFRRKRTPDGAISKYKACYCVRGDLEESEPESFAPVVAWSSVRLFLVLALTLGWYTSYPSTSAVHSYRQLLTVPYGYTYQEVSKLRKDRDTAYCC